MTVDTFFEKFEEFADAPGAVERMREVVLQFGVSGGFFGTKGWQPTQLGGVCDRIHYGYTAKANPDLDAVRLLRITDIQNNTVNWDTVPGCEISENDLPKYQLGSGDILIARTGGTVGKSFLVQSDPPSSVFASYLIRLQPSENISPDYLKRFLESPSYWLQLIEAARGAAQPNVNGKTLGQINFSLPPLAEQKRIVAKVDELMALCDQLEAQQQERDTRADQLARASLARFAEAPTPRNLNFLFHPSYTISPADLRKSILTLAVQGKLVPQNIAKEDGNKEIEEIFKRKASMLLNKEIRKTEIGRPIEASDIDHQIPSTWNWVRLVDICELITDGTHQTPKYTDSGRMFLSAQNVKPFKFMPEKHRFVSEEHYQGYIKNRKPGIGDILLTRVGAGIGEAASIDQDLDFAIYVSLGLIRPVKTLTFPDYITLWLNSPDGTAKSSKNTYGKGVSQGNLNLGLIRQFLVPLPPLAEQKRIVAKVDELMALVDELETQLDDSRTTAKNLLEALVAELTAAGAPDPVKSTT